MRRLAEQIARGTIGAGHGLPTIAWGVADASGEATFDALVEAADRAMYRQKQLMRKRTPVALARSSLHGIAPASMMGAVGNLLLRVGFALSIVGAAIGMTAAANSVPPCEGSACPPAASVAPVVAGYEAAPVAAERAATSNTSTQQAATLVALTTTVVLLAILVILFVYRPRPGGVRASHR